MHLDNDYVACVGSCHEIGRGASQDEAERDLVVRVIARMLEGV